MAYVGIVSVALVPSAAAACGLSRVICALPLMSLQRSSTSVLVFSPEPTSVTAWPALAPACPASAGVPLNAADVMLARLTVKDSLVPPPVFAVIAPNAPSLSGTVMRA